MIRLDERSYTATTYLGDDMLSIVYITSTVHVVGNHGNSAEFLKFDNFISLAKLLNVTAVQSCEDVHACLHSYMESFNVNLYLKKCYRKKIHLTKIKYPVLRRRFL